MTKNLILFILLISRLSFLSAQNQSTNLSTQPNIIIILVDDLGYEDVGFNSCKDIPTPNIDKIASRGV